MKHLAVAVLLIAFLPYSIHSQKPSPSPVPLKVTISQGFLSGEEYLNLDTTGKRSYAMGVLSGMLTAPLFGAPEEKVSWLSSCAVNMSDEQVAAILTKYLRDNPGKWQYAMNVTSFNAMRASCPHPKP